MNNGFPLGKYRTVRRWDRRLVHLQSAPGTILVANDVEGEPKQVATVLTLIGGPTYGLLVNLLAPEEPAKQKLADIFATLDGHFAPKPLVIAERYRFNKRDQRPGEPAQ